MRDLSKVIDFLLKNVIPMDQTALKSRLRALMTSIMYNPPESQIEDWSYCATILASTGDPIGTEWKERMRRIFNDEEKVDYDSGLDADQCSIESLQ